METFVWILFLISTLTSALPAKPRVIVNAANTTYDYVIVGCGIAGLVVSMRLSESPEVSVLCIEAGELDNYDPIIMYPFYIGAGIDTRYDWNVSTVPQMQLDGTARPIPMGRGVGGGSLINGMIWNRGNQEDFEAWVELGNPGWGWSDLLPYFQKSETYTPEYYDDQEQQLVTFDPQVHGFSGPVQVSYPQYFWNQSDNWVGALKRLNVPEVFDPNQGNSAGGFYLPVNIHPTNQTRSDARRAYYDPYASRPNFDVLNNSQVTRVLFDTVFSKSTTIIDGITQPNGPTSHATAVEYASSPGTPRQTVFASREIILAAGAIHSPQILQYSGIGPSAILSNYSITVVEDLIGVGNNLQDHCMVHLDYSYQLPGLTSPNTFQYNESYNTECEAEYIASKSGPWTGRPSTAVAFPSLPQIINDTETFALVNSARLAPRYLPEGYDANLRAGYELQLASTISRLLSNTTPAFENLNNNGGGLDVSLQHPLSRGTVQVASSDPFTPPLVDPRWLTHPLDSSILIAAMQFNQRILDTPEIAALMPSYPQISRDASVEEITGVIMRELATEFHYSGTCSMMPRELGGVVDSQLRVYGTECLRVVDSSVFPIVPAAHLQAVVYAVAEKAADLIKGPTTTNITMYSNAALPVGSGLVRWIRKFFHLPI